MSENNGKKDENVVLDCSITPEFFKNDKESETRFKIVLQEIINYIPLHDYILKNLETSYSSLEKKYLEKLPFKYQDKIEKLKKCFEINNNFFSKIASLYTPKFSFETNVNSEYINNRYYESRDFVGTYFLKCLKRDWTKESEKEREYSYGKTLNQLKKYINFDDKELMSKKNYKVLVPGTGCSRMVYELAKRGFEVECNDFCYIYIMCGDYLFNHSHKNEFQFCPKINSFEGCLTEESALKKYNFPDVDIKKELKNANAKKIIFTKGDFYSLYKDKKDCYDVIITLFFIDIAKNIIEYVELMQNMLKKGGIWISLGCLDYYYSYLEESIDLTWDELKYVITQYNFEIKNEELGFVPFGEMEQSFSFRFGSSGTVFFTAIKK